MDFTLLLEIILKMVSSKTEDHFNKLNNFEGDDLKIYLKTLKENAITESNQAGVGLIDVKI